MALYEPGAVLALPDGGTATGADAIRQFYEELLANKPTFVPGPLGRHSATVTAR